MLYVSFDAMLYEHCHISWVYGSYMDLMNAC